MNVYVLFFFFKKYASTIIKLFSIKRIPSRHVNFTVCFNFSRPVSNYFLHYFPAQCTMIFDFSSSHNSAIFSNFIHFPKTYVKRFSKNRASNGRVDPPFASIFALSNLTKTQTPSVISSFFYQDAHRGSEKHFP